MITITDDEFAALRSHRNRIHRDRRLLESEPTEFERQCLKQRLSEELGAFDALVAAKFPLVFKTSHAADREPSASVTADDANL